MSITGISQIDSRVPFGSHISWWLRYINQGHLETLAWRSEQYERRYLAWEQVRRGGNPFLENGTGFEGYFVGVCSSPEEALRSILKVGQTILTNLVSFHRFEHLFQTKLVSTLTGQVFNQRALLEWSAEFGAELARLRCNVLVNPQAQAFRADLYHRVDGLPHIVYTMCDPTIRQRYGIFACCVQGSRIVVNSNQLSPSDQDAWQVAHEIGKFGHPLLRQYMDLGTLTA